MFRNESKAYQDFSDLPPSKQDKVVEKLAAKLHDKSTDRLRTLYALGKIGVNAKKSIPSITDVFTEKEFHYKANAAYALSNMGNDAVPGLIELLKNNEPSVRGSAAWALGRISSSATESVPFLLEALHDENNDVRYYAVEALGKINTPVIPDLIAALGDTDSKVGAAAVTALIKTGAPAVPALINSLKSESSVVKVNTVYVLGGIGPPAAEALPALAVVLKASTGRDKALLLRALIDIGAELKSNIEEINEVLSGQDYAVIGPVRFALIKRGLPSVPIFLELLKSGNSQAKYNSAGALGAIGPSAKEAIPTLVIALEETDQRLKVELLSALRKIGPTENVIPVLINNLLAKDFMIRRIAADTLGEIGAPAIPYLLHISREQRTLYDSMLLGEVLARIFKMIGTPAGPYLIEGVKDKDEQIRGAAFSALYSLGASAKDAAPSLIEVLSEVSDKIKIQALSVLKGIGPDAKAAVTAIVELLRSESPYLKANAAEALIKISPKDAEKAVPDLITLLNGRYYPAKDAADALGRIGPAAKNAVPYLEERLKETSEVAINSALALWRINKSKKGLTVLISGLGSKTPGMTELSLAKIGEMGPAAKKVIPDLRRILREKDSTAKENTLIALSNMGEYARDALPELIEILKSKTDFRAKHKAAIVLSKMGKNAKNALPELIEILKNAQDDELKAITGETIAALGPDAKEAIPTIVEGLQSKYKNFQDFSAKLLSKIGISSIPALIYALSNENRDVRVAAANALGEIGPAAKDAIPALIEIFKDKGNVWAKQAAEDALKRIDPVVNKKTQIATL